MSGRRRRITGDVPHTLRRLIRGLFCVIVCSLLAAGPLTGVVDAAGLSPVVADCNTHARLTHQYSLAQLRNALATMPADVKEYTNCSDVIQRQLLAQLGGVHGHGGSGTQGGSFLPTPVIVVLALLVLGGAGFAAYAWRRRGEGSKPG
jgi:hypothetical protein